jgi:RNA polymerase sigma factor FliA
VDDLVSEHYRWVGTLIYRHFQSYLKYHTFDDLFAYGLVGLWDAASKYDEEKGSFLNYATWRVKGAIQDGIREIDPMPRSGRDLLTAYKNARTDLENVLGLTPTLSQVRNYLVENCGWTNKQFYRLIRAYNFTNPDQYPYITADGEEHDTVESEEKTPLAEVILAELRSDMVKAVTKLPEIEKVVIDLYYWEDMQLKEIGKVFDLSESRISQIHSKALKQLRTIVTDRTLLQAF